MDGESIDGQGGQRKMILNGTGHDERHSVMWNVLRYEIKVVWMDGWMDGGRKGRRRREGRRSREGRRRREGRRKGGMARLMNVWLDR